jgi:hypothetical protein
MARSRRCCCCHNFYSIEPAIWSVTGDGKATRKDASPQRFQSDSPTTNHDNTFTGSIAVDWVNKQIYCWQNNDIAVQQNHISRWEKDMMSGQKVFTVSAGFHVSADGTGYALAVHPQTSRIIYPAVANGTSKPSLIRTVNYDGTSDQTIRSFTSPAGSNIGIRVMQVTKRWMVVLYD